MVVLDSCFCKQVIYKFQTSKLPGAPGIRVSLARLSAFRTITLIRWARVWYCNRMNSWPKARGTHTELFLWPHVSWELTLCRRWEGRKKMGRFNKRTSVFLRAVTAVREGVNWTEEPSERSRVQENELELVFVLLCYKYLIITCNGLQCLVCIRCILIIAFFFFQLVCIINICELPEINKDPIWSIS